MLDEWMRTSRLRKSDVDEGGGMHEIGNVRRNVNVREQERGIGIKWRLKLPLNPLPRPGEGTHLAAY